MQKNINKLPKLVKEWSEEEVDEFLGDSEDANLAIELFSVQIEDSFYLIEQYSSNTESLINSCFSLSTFASIISLITISSGGPGFTKIYLYSIFPFLGFSIALSLLILAKRRYIDVVSMPEIVKDKDNYLRAEFITLKKKHELCEEVAEQLYSQFKHLEKLFRFYLSGMIAFFVAFCVHFYLYSFNVDIKPSSRVILNLLMVIVGIIVYLRLCKGNKDFIK